MNQYFIRHLSNSSNYSIGVKQQEKREPLATGGKQHKQQAMIIREKCKTNTVRGVGGGGTEDNIKSFLSLFLKDTKRCMDSEVTHFFNYSSPPINFSLPSLPPLLKYFLKLVLSLFPFPSYISYNNLSVHLCGYYEALFQSYRLDDNVLNPWGKHFIRHIFSIYYENFRYTKYQNSKMNLYVYPQPKFNIPHPRITFPSQITTITILLTVFSFFK